MLALVKPTARRTTPTQKEAQIRIQALEDKAARSDRLERELLSVRQELAALKLKQKQNDEKAKAWDRLVLSVSMSMQDLPVTEYNNRTRHVLQQTALNWTAALERAGIPANGLRWLLQATNEYSVRLLTHVNESRVMHNSWLNRATHLTTSTFEPQYRDH